MSRPDWDEYFFKMAETVATMSSCLSAQVGSIIVKKRRIVATGYNGAPSGRPDCSQLSYCYRASRQIPSGTQLESCHACGAHSETNAISMSARFGIAVEGAYLYLVGHDQICAWCQSVLLNAGIKKVFLKNRAGEVKVFYPAKDFIRHPFLPYPDCIPG